MAYGYRRDAAFEIAAVAQSGVAQPGAVIENRGFGAVEELCYLYRIGDAQTQGSQDSQFRGERAFGDGETAFGLEQHVDLLDEVREHGEEGSIEMAIEFFVFVFCD